MSTVRPDAAVVLWGAKGSGKSGFLGAMWHVDEDVTDAGVSWAISPGDVGDGYSSDYLRNARSDLAAGRRNATPPDAASPAVRVTARRWQNHNPSASLPLAFRDPAGEFADDAVRARNTAGVLIDDMLRAAGIIWLFDGAAPTPPRLAEIARHIGTVRERNGGRPVTTAVAFCVSKIDQMGAEERARAIADPKAAVTRAASPEVIDLLETTFINRRYFAISSKGTEPGRIRPIGQNAVLDWVYGEYRRLQTGAFVSAHKSRIAVSALALAVVLALAALGNWYFRGEPARKRALAEQQLLGRLELAGGAYVIGAMDSVVRLLQPPELPRRHPRRIEWDTLLAFASYDAGFSRKLAGTAGATADSARSLIAVAMDRTASVVGRVMDADAAARIRFKHAEACISAGCGERGIRKDLEYVIENAKDSRLVSNARDRLVAVQERR
ncbi:MAG: hypothetical protein ABIS27_04715 [Longimicrobiales bacterium]